MFLAVALSLATAGSPADTPPVHAMGVECRRPPDPAVLATYFSNSDYPMSAIRNHEQGTVEFCVRVGADGSVTDCAILVSSGFPNLDAATCDVAKARFRFTPAHDARGNYMPDGIMGRVRWVLPPAPCNPRAAVTPCSG